MYNNFCMAKIEMSFALYDSLLKIKADREGVIEHEVGIPCRMYGIKIEPVTGDDRRFAVVISHPDEIKLQAIIESTRSSLKGSGIVFNGEVC